MTSSQKPRTRPNVVVEFTGEEAELLRRIAYYTRTIPNALALDGFNNVHGASALLSELYHELNKYRD